MRYKQEYLELMKKDLEKALINYLSRKANKYELDMIEDWLMKDFNEQEFHELVKVNHLIDSNLMRPDLDRAKTKFLKQLKADKKKARFRVLKASFKYAAIIIMALFAGYILKDWIAEKPLNKPINSIVETAKPSEIKIGTDKAILTLDNGEQVILQKDSAYNSTFAKSDGKALTYSNTQNSNHSLRYNILNIPRGGQFYVKLSDGTQIWLNSESQLKYPVQFVEGETRQVELVYGEAYFEVSPSTEHKSSQFKVFTKGQEIEVLGTEFNVKAYNDEDYIYTTLVEGKITLSTNNGLSVLNPSYQSVVSLEDGNILVKQVDTYYEVAWIKGLFAFKEKSLKDIMKVISRWYDVKTIFADKSLEDIKFKGVLSKNQNIEEILTLIKNTKFINAYEINNNNIIIKN